MIELIPLIIIFALFVLYLLFWIGFDIWYDKFRIQHLVVYVGQYLKTPEPEYYILHKCTYPFWDYVLWLRNSERQGFVVQQEITTQEHHEYMLRNSQNYKILSKVSGSKTKFDDFVGFVGVVNFDIRIAVTPKYQRKGFAKRMLQLALEDPKFQLADARVKKDNIASKKLFESVGYEQFKEDENFYYFRYRK